MRCVTSASPGSVITASPPPASPLDSLVLIVLSPAAPAPTASLMPRCSMHRQRGPAQYLCWPGSHLVRPTSLLQWRRRRRLLGCLGTTPPLTHQISSTFPSLEQLWTMGDSILTRSPFSRENASVSHSFQSRSEREYPLQGQSTRAIFNNFDVLTLTAQ